ncbi:MAG: 2-amino-4-hydroxy-6-hydroxymethyldihydropteridine diphosphokinase [Bacteriovoracaceae bacterium]|nr:2-amino-4-hydroxy-6-hydroxymethyldihydropteridine diphosphokinase [Bacteriovoracaceae bacterium]
MSLIIATGSNIGHSLQILKDARQRLSESFELIAESRIYTSPAVEYENQPDFFNQVLEFKIPDLDPEQVMQKLLDLEQEFGRNRNIPKGPRTLDLDIIFWNLEKIDQDALTVPHPRWAERSFVVKPLKELPFFQTIEKCFTIPKSFIVDAFPV